MLSLVELKALSQIFGACCRTHCLPLDWDPVNYQLRVTRSRSKLYMSRILLGWKLAYAIVIVLRLHPDLTWNLCERRIEQQIFHALLAICTVNVCVERGTLIFFPEEICLLFNRLILFNKQQGNSSDLCNVSSGVLIINIFYKVYVSSKLNTRSRASEKNYSLFLPSWY